ncbi:MAG: AsmA family protein [Nitrospirales bacterium]
MKRAMIIISIILGLLFILVLALPYLLDLNRYRDHYIPLVERALNRKVDISNIRMMWFPNLGIQIDDAKIYDDPHVTQQPFVEVTSIELAVKWKPLFQRRIEVQSLTLDQPFISIIHTKDEAMNVATLGKRKPTEDDAASVDESFLAVLGVEQLIILEGTISYEDHSKEQFNTYQLKNFEMRTESVSLGDTAKISAQATLTPQQLPLSVEASLGPLQQNFDIPHIEAFVIVGTSSIVAKGQALDGTVDIDLRSSEISLNDLPLHVHLDKPVVLTDVFAHINTVISHKDASPSSQKELTVSPFSVQMEMGSSILNVTGSAVGQMVEVQATAPVIHSEDLPFPLSLHGPVSVSNLEVKVQTDGALVDVTALTGKVFDGHFRARGAWDGGTTFHSLGELQNINVEQVQKVLKPAPVTLHGTGAMNWNINGTLVPGKFPPLSGRAQLTIGDGQLNGIDLLQRIEQILKLKNPLSTRRGVTTFSRFQGKVEFLKDGIPIKSVRLEGHEKEFLMQGAGKVNLDQSIMVNGNLRLGENVSGKIMKQMPLAKIALQEDNLVVPFTIKGTLSEPNVGLDFNSIQKRIQNQVGQAVQDILKGDPKDVKEILKQGKSFFKGLFGK